MWVPVLMNWLKGLPYKKRNGARPFQCWLMVNFNVDNLIVWRCWTAYLFYRSASRVLLLIMCKICRCWWCLSIVCKCSVVSLENRWWTVPKRFNHFGRRFANRQQRWDIWSTAGRRFSAFICHLYAFYFLIKNWRLVCIYAPPIFAGTFSETDAGTSSDIHLTIEKNFYVE